MLFNSYGFLFIFLPITVLVFYAFGVFSRAYALAWLILASTFFYAWWRPFNILLIAPSILVNFVLAVALLRLGADEKNERLSKLVLLFGLFFNLAFLGYFKYSDFARTMFNDAFGTNLVLSHIILPLGVSFITFQKIAFLIDVHAKRVTSFTFRDYCLFVLFFPQLIAGPIVHYREMMPQFQKASCRFNQSDVAVGLTLLFFGLFKKAALADNMGALVSPIYQGAAAGHPVSLLVAWMAGIGFTLQVYFDFSGYSDMALGLARFFGVKLPPNFNSPLKASNIIDFWQRWHMTLTRFVMAYVYNPLLLRLTRRRVERGHAVGGRTLGAFAELQMFPLIVTMALIGIWHGAGYLFFFFGLLHGIYLTINHAWHIIAPSFWKKSEDYLTAKTLMSVVLTFICVVIGMVLFRSATMEAARNMLSGMIGLNGIAIPQAVADHLGPLAAWLHQAAWVGDTGHDEALLRMCLWFPLLFFIVFALPNTLQILAPYEPALGVKPVGSYAIQWPKIAEWRVSVPWAIAMSAIAAIGIFSLHRQSEFLYWQF
jgi:D-alanyl-lipoteichoic acid acyltransferase DltB (MBOAT superfamily)